MAKNDNEIANGKIFTITKNDDEQGEFWFDWNCVFFEIFGFVETADFETAIKATGFGKYNGMLLLISIPAALAPMFETTTMSLVFPAAQCDLDLSLQNKGTLNAITYLGICSLKI